MNESIMIAGMAVVTFSLRYVMFAMAGRIAQAGFGLCAASSA
tara:strand:- start:58 stop:183 length:126 start_codon:yes stop_codon:yes gene_type:complete